MKFVDIKNKEELEAYHYAEMRKQDEIGKTQVAVRKAVEKAVKEAVEKTVEKTKEERNTEMAKEMIIENFPKEQIARISKLSLQTIEKLINEIKK